MTNFIDINTLTNPESGKTYREENLEKQHNIPLRSLVEVKADEDEADFNEKSSGLRLWVVSHDRDFDGTPLYSLSFDKDWTKNMYGKEYKAFAMKRIDNGYPEESLTLIK